MDLGARISMWDAEAATYDKPADHGLADPDVREAWRRLLPRRSRRRRHR